MLAITTCRAWLSWIGITAPIEKTKSETVLEHIEYKSQNNDASAIKNVTVSLPENNQILKITMRFRVDTFKDYIYLFQTAPLNSGISVAIANDGSVKLMVDSINARRFIGPNNFKKVTLNQWHALELTIWKNHSFKVKYDGLIVENRIDPDINYQISEIRLGAGYPPTHYLNGEITDFKITSNVIDLKYQHYINLMLTIIFIGLLYTTIISFFLLCKQQMNRQSKIELLSFLVLIGFFTAVVFNYCVFFYWNKPYPQNTFIFYTLGSEFGDFYLSRYQDLFFAPYDKTLYPHIATYLPFSYVIIYPLTKLSAHLALIIYSLFFTISLVLFVKYYFSHHPQYSFEKIADIKNIIIISLLSYPFLFCLERANLENLCFILVALSFYFFEKRIRVLAAFCLGMASAMKLYPLLLSIFFLSEKKYFEFILSIVFTLIVTLWSLVILDPSFSQNVTVWLESLNLLGNYILIDPTTCMKFNLGIWGIIKFICISMNLSSASLMHLAKWYHSCALFSAFIVIGYVLFIETIAWRKLIMLVIPILIFPELSNDYKLLYVFLPLASFINAKPQNFDLFYLCIFVFLLIPKSYYWVTDDISIANFLNPAVMLLTLIIIMYSGLRKKFLIRKNAIMADRALSFF